MTPNMFTKAIGGMPIEDATAWAEHEMRRADEGACTTGTEAH